jgi:hypothetical protein
VVDVYLTWCNNEDDLNTYRLGASVCLSVCQCLSGVSVLSSVVCM